MAELKSGLRTRDQFSPGDGSAFARRKGNQLPEAVREPAQIDGPDKLLDALLFVGPEPRETSLQTRQLPAEIGASQQFAALEFALIKDGPA